MNKTEALQEITLLIKKHKISFNEIKQALENKDLGGLSESSIAVNALFAYAGGLLVFAGLCLFIGLQWDHITSISRIALTLGMGFCSFIVGIFLHFQKDYYRAALPLFFIAAILESLGLAICFIEFYPTIEPRWAVLMISSLMLIQQSLTFISLKRTELLVFTLIFGIIFFATMFDILFVPYNTQWLILSISLLCISWAIDKSSYNLLAPPLYFFSSFVFLSTSFDVVKDQPYEIVYLPITCFMIFIGIISNSTLLLINSTVAFLAYISYFTGHYFLDTLGWPITLIIIGALLIGFSSLVFKMHRKYVRKSN